MSVILKNRNILFLFLTSFFRGFLLLMPILTLYLQDNELSMKEIMILQTIFSIIIVFLEIPSWYLADIFKRKYLIIFWAFFSLLWTIWYYFFDYFWWFVLVEILLWIWISMNSGSDTAYLYDELLSKKQENKYQEIEWKYWSVSNFSEAIAAIFSSFLVTFWFKIVVIFQIFVNALWFISSLFLQEHKKNVKENNKLSFREVYDFLFKQNNKIKSLILFSSVLWSSTLIFLWLSQPFWEESWLSIMYFWIFWAGLNFLVGISSIFAYKMEKIIGFKKLFILFWIFSFIFYLFLWFSENLILILVLSSCFWIFRWLQWPIIKDYVNREVDSKMRATIISIKNLFFRIIFSVLSPFIWYFADIYNFQTAFFISAFIFFILWWSWLLWVFVWFWKKKYYN